MKRLIVMFLVLIMSFSFIVTVSALSPSQMTLSYDLSCNGENVISGKTGDIITVTYTLNNVTDGTAYNISSVANEIYYDHTFFEYVEGSATVTSGLNQSADLKVYSNGEHRVYFNGFEIPAKEYSSNQIIGTFQLKIIATSGSSTIGSRNMLASSSEIYNSMSTDLVVRIGDAPIIPVYSLVFETNGGTSIFTVKKNEGTVVDLSVFRPIKDGYTFGGWYSDAELTIPVTSITLNGNTTVYAKWNKIIPQIPYVGENGNWWIGEKDTNVKAEGTDGVGIVSVVINEAGKLVITYTNNETVELDMPAGMGKCAECVKVKKYEAKKANCLETSEYVVVCEDCNHAWVEYGVIDPDNHEAAVVTVVDPTCIDYGYTTKVCPCGALDGEETDIKEALGHDYVQTKIPAFYNYSEEYVNGIVTFPTCEEDGYVVFTCKREGCVACDDEQHIVLTEKDLYNDECEACNNYYVVTAEEDDRLVKTGHADEADYVWVTVVDAGANLCVDGGQELLMCPKCIANPTAACKTCEKVYIDQMEIPALGHDVTSEWTLTKAPTLTETGLITGPCADCGLASATRVLPALNKTDYVWDEADEATCTTEGKDTYTITIDKYVDDEEYWTKTFEVVTTKMHSLNSNPINNDEVQNIIPGLVASGNYPADCLKTGFGVYTCDDCQLIQIVKIYGTHSAESTVVDSKSYPESCWRDGLTTMDCPTCGKEWPIVHQMGDGVNDVDHKLADFDFIYDEVDTEKVIGATLICTNEGCIYTEEFLCDGFKVDEENSTLPRCDQAGSIMYIYLPTGEEDIPENWKPFESNGSRVTVTLTIGHNYMGEDGVQREYDTSTTKVYTVEELEEIFVDGLDTDKGFEWSGNYPSTCQTPGYGVATCSDCGVPTVINATGNHVWAPDSTTPATCLDNEYTTYACQTAGCTETKDVEKADSALGHAWVLDINNSDFEEGATEGTLHFDCSRCDATDDVEAFNVELKTDAPTCLANGKEYYEYDYYDHDTILHENVQKVTKTLYNPDGTHFYVNGETYTIDTTATWEISDLKVILGNNTDEYLNNGEIGSCLEKTEAVFDCSVCSKKQIIFNVIGDHVYGNEIPATCTEAAKQVCTVVGCGHVKYSDDELKQATGHDYEWEITTKPTTTAGGTLTVTCKNLCNCGYNAEIDLPDLTQWTPAHSAPTCSTEGAEVYKLNVTVDDKGTEETADDDVAELEIKIDLGTGNHTNAVPPIVVEWSDEEWNYTGYYCAVCNQIIVTAKTPVEAAE